MIFYTRLFCHFDFFTSLIKINCKMLKNVCHRLPDIEIDENKNNFNPRSSKKAKTILCLKRFRQK